MARQTSDRPITTRAARERLAPRDEPYWRAFDTRAALGYRRSRDVGTWIARVLVDGRYRKSALGRADDALKSDGVTVLDFRQAEAKARDWASREVHKAAGLDSERAPNTPYTVADALSDYLADYAGRGGKAVGRTRNTIHAHILPSLGPAPVQRLTRDRIKQWHRTLAAAPPRLRSRQGELNFRRTDGDPEAPRRRRSSANRILTILRAALNHARAEGRVSCPPDAWAAVKPFREAEGVKVHYLLDDEVTRLLNACPADLRQLATAALLTGARYGELAVTRVSDFDPQAGTVTIAASKSGNARHVVLTDEGAEFFARQAAGKARATRMFERDVMIKQATKDAPAEVRRGAWGRSDAFRALRATCAAARIVPPITFHGLRHSYASSLAMAGAPMAVIAAQLGHADLRMTTRHYAHLAPSFVSTTVRNLFAPLNVLTPSNVFSVAARQK
jgi:integrase